jgi:hypothetical protein
MADPPFLYPASNRFGRFMEDERETDEGTGEKNGGKGVEIKAGGKNVDLVLSAGDSDDLDGNSTRNKDHGDCEGNDGDRNKTDGQVLTVLGHGAKEPSAGAMITGGTTITETLYDGEPKESDVIYNLNGSIGFGDRSLGGEFLTVGKKNMGKASATTTATTVQTVSATAVSKVGSADGATALIVPTDKDEDKKMTPMEQMMREKERMDRVRREFGIERCNLAAFAPKRLSLAAPLQTSLAASLASGGTGSAGIGKLTMLQSKTASKKAVTVEMKVDKTPKLNATSNEVEAQNHQSARGIGGLFRSAVGAMKSGNAAKTAAAVMAAAGARPKATTTVVTTNPRNDNTSLEERSEASIETRKTGNANATLENRMEASLDTGMTGSGDDFLAMGLAGYTDRATAMELDAATMEHNGAFDETTWEDRESDMATLPYYQVRLEYNDKPNETPRPFAVETRLLALELWRADPELVIHSLNEGRNPITGIEAFPTITADYKSFFASAATRRSGSQKNVIAFTVQTRFSTADLMLCNERALQNFLKGRKLWLHHHRFDSLMIEQIGWFACKMVGAHIPRFEFELLQEINRAILELNCTEEY